MATISELNAAVQKLQTDVAALLAIQSGSVPASELDPIVTAINDLATQIEAVTAPAPPAA